MKILRLLILTALISTMGCSPNSDENNVSPTNSTRETSDNETSTEDETSSDNETSTEDEEDVSTQVTFIADHEVANDDGYSDIYGGNFYIDWQDNHESGVDYWKNLLSPDGQVAFGAHNTQHITANRKAMAFWWILARLAGWNGEAE